MKPAKPVLHLSYAMWQELQWEQQQELHTKYVVTVARRIVEVAHG